MKETQKKKKQSDFKYDPNATYHLTVTQCFAKYAVNDTWNELHIIKITESISFLAAICWNFATKQWQRYQNFYSANYVLVKPSA